MVVRSFRIKQDADDVDNFSNPIELGAKAKNVIVEIKDDNNLVQTIDLQTYLSTLSDEAGLRWTKM